MSSNVVPQKKSTILFMMPLVLVALALFVTSLISLFKHQFKLDAYSTILLLFAAFLLSAGSLFTLFSKIEIGLTGIKAEARELAESINSLSDQVKALGHLAVFEQVSTLNRLAIEKPELTRVWKGMDAITDKEKIGQILYIYCFLDAFQIMLHFSEGKLLTKEMNELWRKKWISELLECETGKFMQEQDMLSYYAPDFLEACGISSKAR